MVAVIATDTERLCRILKSFAINVDHARLEHALPRIKIRHAKKQSPGSALRFILKELDRDIDQRLASEIEQEIRHGVDV